MLIQALAFVQVTALVLSGAATPVKELSLVGKAKELSHVDMYLKGEITKQEFEHTARESTQTKSWQVAIQELKHTLPSHIASLLRTETSTKKAVTKKFDDDALDRARETLNGMIETSRAEYDLKDMECRAFDERNREEYKQTEKDLSNLGSAIATDNAKILTAKKDIGNAQTMIIEQWKFRMASNRGCFMTRWQNQMQLRTLKNDLAVAEFIVHMTKCGNGIGEFLQAMKKKPEIQQCPIEDGSTQLTFGDEMMRKKVQEFGSEQARQFLRVALANSHPKIQHQQLALINQEPTPSVGKKVQVREGNSSLVSVVQSPEEEPLPEKPQMPPPVMSGGNDKMKAVPPQQGGDVDKLADKCIMSEVDCGLLNDNMALMWGQIKDQVDELTSIMADNAAICKQMNDMYNMEINTWMMALGDHNVELSEATSSLNTNTEEQKEAIAERDMLEEEYNKVHGECVDILHEIFYTNICGVIIVRGQISKFHSAYGPTDILDCEVTPWIPQECSVECIPQNLCEGLAKGVVPPEECNGGIQDMRRNIVQNKSLGAECPALLLQKPCNEYPCPTDCKMTEWSPFGKCSKDCGGGLRAKSRNIEVRAENGGEACGADSEAELCNMQSCDVDCVLHDWTAWSPCTRACAAGVSQRDRPIDQPKEGFGKCEEENSFLRHQSNDCNAFKCPPFPFCVAKQDIVLVVDVSGSLKEDGFNTVKSYTEEFLKMSIVGEGLTNVGIVEYSDMAKVVSPMTNDMEELMTNFDKIEWQRGVTDMAQGISLAQTVLLEGRKDAQSIVIVLTDGKPSFRWATKNAAVAIRKHGVRLVFVPIFEYGDDSFMHEIASEPSDQNVVTIGGLEHLAEHIEEEAINLMTGTCSEIIYFEEPGEDPWVGGPGTVPDGEYTEGGDPMRESMRILGGPGTELPPVEVMDGKIGNLPLEFDEPTATLFTKVLAWRNKVHVGEPKRKAKRTTK